MTELLERAVAIARELDPATQDRLARMMIAESEKGLPDYQLTDEDRAAIQRGIEAADRGEFASDEEVAATLTKYRQ